jgi:hypothetical protein
MIPIFSSKLDRLIETIEAACRAEPGVMSESLAQSAAHPVAAVGSGGSAVAAEFLSSCRTWLLHAATAVTTPMAYALDPVLPRWGVWLFSASGDNPDIRAAYETALKEHAPRVDVVTARRRSAVADAISGASRLHVVPVADEKDGFLATHSLVSTLTSLLLASDEVAGKPRAGRIDRLLSRSRDILSEQSRARTAEMLFPLAAPPRDTLLILHDPALTAAAVMVETSCWEAGLCSVQRTDFRNFAHGRHVWLARHAPRTVLLSLTCDRSHTFWATIDSSVPAATARVHLDFGSPGRGGLFEAILTSFGIVEGIGRTVGIDPGKPGVADFGRNIFEAQDLISAVKNEDAATRRKRRLELRSDEPHRCSVPWASRRDEFIHRIGQAEFGALVLDYDGTMVTTERRLDPPAPSILRSIRTLLDGGLSVALATGRGGSVGEELRKHLSEDECARVLVGYYNGAHIVPLAIDLRQHPPEPDPAIAQMHEAICSAKGLFAGDWRPKPSPFQITIAMEKFASQSEGMLRLRDVVEAREGVKLFRSGHSVDICPAWAGKPLVLDAVRKTMSDDSLNVLAIGDSGDREGNDHELLGSDFGLSVDRVCEREFLCWNLLPSGVSGPDGLLTILSGMRMTGTGRARLDVSVLRGL